MRDREDFMERPISVVDGRDDGESGSEDGGEYPIPPISQPDSSAIDIL